MRYLLSNRIHPHGRVFGVTSVYCDSDKWDRGGNYYAGETVEIVADETSSQQFEGWTGNAAFAEALSSTTTSRCQPLTSMSRPPTRCQSILLR